MFALVLLAINFFVASRATESTSRVGVPYSPFFLNEVNAGHVKEITSKGTAIQGTFTEKVKYANNDPTTNFKTEVPAFANHNALSNLLQEKNVVVNAKPLDTGTPFLLNLLLGFGPTLLFVFLLFWFARRAGNVQNVLGSFGRSSARRYQPSGDRVTFKDVAGIEEAKQELTEVVDFLRHPEKYRKLGGRIPHGVLLSGAPGTGKTLLARAVAGEADVPFFSMAASEFVEAIVGVGASRVRDLFKQAKEAAPAIVFIDELDAIGRSRTSGVAGFSGGNDEREQTLNQILTEMDGFDSNTSVIVIGATNRPEVLDQALLRPGRFDRRVAVSPPDRTGREAILKVHSRGVPLDPDVDLSRIAATTPGMVGADLANLVNEAALLAARRNHEKVNEADFTDALERIILGAERQVMIGPEERRRTAYHEAGHAIVGMLTEGADPVRKVSIIPRGHGPRRDLRLARQRPLQLPPARDPGQDHGRARRPHGRGGRLRRHQHRRRVRHPAAHRHRPPDGGPLGDEPDHRPGRRDPARRQRAAAARRGRDLARHPGPDRRRSAPHHRRGAPRGHHAAAGPPRQARRARRRVARARDPGRGGRLRGRRRPPRRPGSGRAVARRRAG